MEKTELLDSLIGVGSSKLSHYSELKDKTRELEERNKELEILNEIAKEINVDSSLESTLIKVALLLNQVMSIEYINLYLANITEKICVEKRRTANGYNKFVTTNSCNLNTPFQRPYSDIYLQETIFPLTAKNQLLGYLSLKIECPVNLTVKKGEFLFNLTEHMSIGLENSRLYKTILALNKQWEDTFKAITDHIYVIDSNYNLIQFNEAAKSYYQISKFKRDSSQKCYQILHNLQRPCSNCPAQLAFEHGEASQYRTEHGTNYFDVNVYPSMDGYSKIIGCVLYERNVTEKVLIESQLIQSAKLKSTGEMAAGIAHELNNPLTTILGNAHLLMAEFKQWENSDSELSDKKELTKLTEKIFQSGKRCKSIIKNFLSFAREKGTNSESVHLNDCLDNILNMIYYQLEKSVANVKIRKEQNLPIFAGNKQQIEQVILNFIFNAMDAVEDIETSQIDIVTGQSQDVSGEWVYLRVSDNGDGISDQHKDSIFQPFYTTKEKSKGYGLGLFVSLGIVENHGGKITLESSENNGSIFTMYLPYESVKGDDFVG